MAVERTDLETYIDTVKRDTATWVTEHPFTGADADMDVDDNPAG